ncbi:MAG: CBS domain-containing protein [Gammaproteobacteria bacterium]|nr:CBS domain-containing protein [Gammaproteobacteria bacterium]
MSEDAPSTNGPGLSNWLRRIISVVSGKPQGREELLEFLKDAEEQEMFDSDVQSMLEGVLEVSDAHVRDVMIPRSQMTILERDAPAAELLKTIVDSGHSRFPVIGEDRDEVIGILLAKDLLRFYVEHEGETFDIRECLRPAAFVPESKRLNVLLREFRANRNHMAVVVDEYGGVSGLVTIEDVLEQIVGDIDDEHDIEGDLEIQKEADNRYIVRALTRIDDFNEYFDTQLSDEDFDTVGGLVIFELGRLPRRGEKVRYGPFEFQVLRSDRRRVHLLRVRRHGQKQDGSADDNA